MEQMKKQTAEFIKSNLAGAAISLGGMVYLSCENKIVGAFLFSVGLVTVVLLGLNLYTGRIGYVIGCDKPTLITTLLSIPGNLVGCLAVGFLKAPVGEAASICAKKLEKGLLPAFADAILCGVLIYICVEIFKKHGKLVGIFLCIPTFILCGFEHSIADMFYFINARVFSLEACLFVLIIVLGNAVGGLAIPVLMQCYHRLSCSWENNQ